MLCFFASELAAVLGANRYKSQSDAFDIVLKRILPAAQEEEADILIGANKPVEWAAPIGQAAAQQMQQECAKEPMEQGVAHVKRAKVEASAVIEQKAVEEVKAAIKKVIEADVGQQVLAALAATQESTTLQNVQDTIAQLPVDVQQAVAPVIERVVVEKAHAVKQVESEIQCAFGTTREDAVRTEHVRTTQVAVKHDNKFLKRVVGRTSLGTAFGVGGRLDGLDAEERVVEIKNRTSRYLGLTVYEKPQLFAYMFIMKTTNAVFIENLNGKSRTLHVEFDEDYWADITGKLESVANLVELVQMHDHIRQEYLQLDSNARTNWIRKHLV
jgi:hypothetical protein